MKRLFSALLAVLMLFTAASSLAETTLTEITLQSEELSDLTDDMKLLITQNDRGVAVTLACNGQEFLLAAGETGADGRLVIGSDLLPDCVVLPSAGFGSEEISFSVKNLTEAGAINELEPHSMPEKGTTGYELDLNRSKIRRLLPAAVEDLKASTGLGSLFGMSDAEFASMVDAAAAWLSDFTESDAFDSFDFILLKRGNAFYGIEATLSQTIDDMAHVTYLRFTQRDGGVNLRFARRIKYNASGYCVDYSSGVLTVYKLTWSTKDKELDPASIIFTTSLDGIQLNDDGTFSAVLSISGQDAVTVNGRLSVISSGDESLFAHDDPMELGDMLGSIDLRSLPEQIDEADGPAAMLLKLLFPGI